MENTKTKFLIGAAIAGLIGAGALAPTSFAADKAPMGKCDGANSCKGKSDCKTASNDCKGKNACGGKGYLHMTQAKCTKAGKKAKKDFAWTADAPA